jgi:hypothetical protein
VFKKLLALTALCFLAQGCTLSIQTDPADIGALKSLVVANAAADRAAANAARGPQVIVIAPTPTTATAPTLAADPQTPKTTGTRWAGEPGPEVKERKP